MQKIAYTIRVHIPNESENDKQYAEKLRDEITKIKRDDVTVNDPKKEGQEYIIRVHIPNDDKQYAEKLKEEISKITRKTRDDVTVKGLYTKINAKKCK